MTKRLDSRLSRVFTQRSLRAALPIFVVLTFMLVQTRRATVKDASPGPERAGAGASSYVIREGSEVFDHYCATCHGKEGTGDGFNAFNLDPKPRDFTSPQFQKTKKDRDLLDAIDKGGASVGLSPAMPPWGKTLSPRDIRALVVYVRHLATSPSSSQSSK
jgi:mono/diheme cytochrome c family protein